MNTLEFKHLKAVRQNLYKFLEGYSLEKLNKVPEGFSNNIFWNIAHCIATQQLLHYYLTNNKMKIDSFWIDNFKKGTSVNGLYSDSNLKDLKIIIHETTSALEDDYYKKLFSQYNSYTTSFGVTLNTIEDAISFNNMHESIHLGYILALRKSI